jgi:hypothetical protein
MINDLLHGKKQTYRADPLAGDINKSAQSGMGMLNQGAKSLNDKFYNNPENFVQSQIDRENVGLRGAADDAARRTRQLISQRGMGESSIGMGQEVNNQRQLNQTLAMNNASGMDRLKGLYQEQMQVGNQLMAPRMAAGPVQMQDVTARKGGIGHLIGPGMQAAATYFGGPAAGAGMGALMNQNSARNYQSGQFQNYA